MLIIQYLSNTFAKIIFRFNISIKYTALYQVSKTIFRTYVSENHPVWEEHLPEIGHEIWSNRHKITNLSPNFILFGREIHHWSAKDRNEDELQFNRFTNFQERHKELENVHEDVVRRLQKAYDRSRVTYILRPRNRQFLPNEKFGDASRFSFGIST